MQVIEAQRPWFWCLTITSIKQIRMFAKADRGAYLYGVAGSREWRDLDPLTRGEPADARAEPPFWTPSSYCPGAGRELHIGALRGRRGKAFEDLGLADGPCFR